MFKILLLAIGLPTIFLLARFIPLLFKRKRKELYQNIDLQSVILEWVFCIVVFFLFLSISIFFKNLTYLTSVLFGVLLGSFIISYGFFIYPFMIIFRRNKFKISKVYQDWAKLNINSQIIIRVVKHDIINAYAAGILSASKVILLSDKMIDNMQEKDIKNLIFHEYGHLKYHHLLILYLSNVLCCSISVISASQFYPIFETTTYPGLLVAFHGALFGALYILVPGLVQRQLEYKADQYASSIVGSASYKETLISLNAITNGGLEKRVINYPTLTDRIKNVSKE